MKTKFQNSYCSCHRPKSEKIEFTTDLDIPISTNRSTRPFSETPSERTFWYLADSSATDHCHLSIRGLSISVRPPDSLPTALWQIADAWRLSPLLTFSTATLWGSDTSLPGSCLLFCDLLTPFWQTVCRLRKTDVCFFCGPFRQPISGSLIYVCQASVSSSAALW